MTGKSRKTCMPIPHMQADSPNHRLITRQIQKRFFPSPCAGSRRCAHGWSGQAGVGCTPVVLARRRRSGHPRSLPARSPRSDSSPQISESDPLPCSFNHGRYCFGNVAEQAAVTGPIPRFPSPPTPPLQAGKNIGVLCSIMLPTLIKHMHGHANHVHAS